MAAAIAPTSCLRFRPQLAARCISFFLNTRSLNLRGENFLRRSKIRKDHTLIHQYHRVYHYSLHPASIFIKTDEKRCFSCTVGAEMVDKSSDVESGEKVCEFRKRLRIVDVKGGPDEGLDRLGKKLVVKGWVRTLRVQSSVTFLEVNDGSCLSNMQCVINPDAEGYDQVESGFISTGASDWVEGVVVISQGSKQKVELNVAKVVTVQVIIKHLRGQALSYGSLRNLKGLKHRLKEHNKVGRSDSSFPVQKKRVSREFLRTKAHLRPRTNTFGAIPSSGESRNSPVAAVTIAGSIDLQGPGFFQKTCILDSLGPT